jgi:1-acyl-sn-glycerol-3-phosphate acyltransferase
MARRDDAPWKPSNLATAARLAGRFERVTTPLVRKTAGLGFPYRKPTAPRGQVIPREPKKLGADFQTEWARSRPAQAVRSALLRPTLKVGIDLVARPTVHGVDRLADLARLDEPPAIIFTPNHHSHLDTLVMSVAVPEPWRSKMVVAAAADYFFDSTMKGAAAALALNALPIDRDSTGRKTSGTIRDIIDDGWSLVIYPEGGRSPDGWGQEFKGGAAYLSSRTGAPVVPVFIDGTGAIFGKGATRLRPGTTQVVFGAPLRPVEGESTRRFAARIEAAVTALADEALTDYWTARQRAAKGTNPTLAGPDYTGWRRQWALSERRQMGSAGLRRRQKRRWPDLGD